MGSGLSNSSGRNGDGITGLEAFGKWRFAVPVAPFVRPTGGLGASFHFAFLPPAMCEAAVGFSLPRLGAAGLLATLAAAVGDAPLIRALHGDSGHMSGRSAGGLG